MERIKPSADTKKLIKMINKYFDSCPDNKVIDLTTTQYQSFYDDLINKEDRERYSKEMPYDFYYDYRQIRRKH